jgi:hypothetical protein
MKFNLFFTFKGPGGIVEVPNKPNPIEAINLADVLLQLAGSISKLGFGLEVVGVRIEKFE